MMKANPKAVPENLVAFGANVYACAELVGRSIDSVALRTAVDPRTFADYLNGRGYLDDEIVEAVCAEFRLSDSKMLAHFDTHAQRMAVLEEQLKAAGFITSSTLIGKSAVEKGSAEPVELKLLVTNDDTSHEDIPDDGGNATMEEPMADEMEQDSAEVAEVTWDDDDLIGTTSDGRQFSLRSKRVRADIIGTVRGMIAERNENLTDFAERVKLGKPSYWWRKVEISELLIYGTDLESIAGGLDVSILSLLERIFAPAPVSEEPPEALLPDTTVSEAVALIADAGPAIIVEPAIVSPAPEPAPVFVLAEGEVPAQVPANTNEQEYFRLLVLSANTEPAPGVSFGQLLELARDQEGVDWQTSFLTLTVAGHDVTSAIDSMSELIADYDPPIRRLFLTALTKACGEVT